MSLGRLVPDVSKDRTALILRVHEEFPMNCLTMKMKGTTTRRKKQLIQFHVYSVEQDS